VHRLWTFRVVGGESFQLSLEGNPSVVHEGRTSVFHLLLADVSVNRFVDYLKQYGGQVEVWPMEGQSLEQKEERDLLMGKDHEEEVYPCVRCPECFWFELRGEDHCGVTAWPSETVEAALAHNQKASKDLVECPLNGEG